MKVINNINKDLLSSLEHFRKWTFSKEIQSSIYNEYTWQKNLYRNQNDIEYAASRELLQNITHESHEGFPIDLYGVDLNYEMLKNSRIHVGTEFLEKIRQINKDVDTELQNYLGARKPALKAFYPAGGYISWHTNWNAPGYNIIFTYSEKGNGYWRHIDPQGSQSVKPDLEKLVHIDDTPGWHCKVGYFGAKNETDKIVWHSAFTHEPRLTVAYVIGDQGIWENMVNEIEEN